jgi:hypothetical protein
MFAGILMLLVSGTAVFWLKTLLIDHPEKLERFMCQLSRSPYPPAAGSWAVKYRIGKMKVLLWALLVVSAMTFCLAILGIFASIALHVVHP